MQHEWTWLWIPATIFAAACQVGRNAIQRSLTEQLGTIGATQVRFLYGFPFAVLFATIAIVLTGSSMPGVNLAFFGFTFLGAISQIVATALMLAAMRQRAFVVVTAWTKTEPVQVAVFGMVVLGDKLSLLAMVAIMLATVGVTIMAKRAPASADGQASSTGWQPVVMGLLAGQKYAPSLMLYMQADALEFLLVEF